jgi:hypothetical protein
MEVRCGAHCVSFPTAAGEAPGGRGTRAAHLQGSMVASDGAAC